MGGYSKSSVSEKETKDKFIDNLVLVNMKELQ